MPHTEINELKRIFMTRLEALEHIVAIGEKHLPDIDVALGTRLAPDMFPLGTQIAFACNQPRGFAQWCAGKTVENLDPDVASVAVAKRHISETKALVAAIDADDAKLGEVKRTGLGPGLFCETPARLYVSDYLMPNFYFHTSMTYALFRSLGVPVGKADYMRFLAPHVQRG